MVASSVLLVFSFYFLLIELLQLLVKGPKGYFFDFWNYIESVPLILIVTNCIFAIKGQTSEPYFWQI